MKQSHSFYLLSSEQRQELLTELGELLQEKTSLQQNLREQKAQEQASQEQLFLELLEVFDALEFLVNYLNTNNEPNSQFLKRLPKSLSNVQQKLLTILARRDVKPIDYQDSQPDYTLCQVVERELEPNLPENTITRIVHQGFTLGNEVLRPLEVITAQNSSDQVTSETQPANLSQEKD